MWITMEDEVHNEYRVHHGYSVQMSICRVHHGYSVQMSSICRVHHGYGVLHGYRIHHSMGMGSAMGMGTAMGVKSTMRMVSTIQVKRTCIHVPKGVHFLRRRKSSLIDRCVFDAGKNCCSLFGLLPYLYLGKDLFLR